MGFPCINRVEADQIGSAGGYLHNQSPILIVLILFLQTVFRQNWHEDVLDLACVQFEPDSADYIRVSCGYNLSRHAITYGSLYISVSQYAPL